MIRIVNGQLKIIRIRTRLAHLTNDTYSTAAMTSLKIAPSIKVSPVSDIIECVVHINN